MPLHRNKSASQKTLNFTGYVTENYILSRERVTVYTQVLNDPSIPEFVFKGKGMRTKVNEPNGIEYE